LAIALDVLLLILVAVAIAALGVLIWALVRAVDTMASVKQLADDTDRDLPPLMAKADATLDAVNDELGRVQGIVEQVKEVTDSVTETKRAADRVVDDAVGGAARVGRVVSAVWRGRKKTS
jgi:ABC-type transporter Mla subunit MlaD